MAGKPVAYRNNLNYDQSYAKQSGVNKGPRIC